jgi:hypothetical protein
MKTKKSILEKNTNTFNLNSPIIVTRRENVPQTSGTAPPAVLLSRRTEAFYQER